MSFQTIRNIPADRIGRQNDTENVGGG